MRLLLVYGDNLLSDTRELSSRTAAQAILTIRTTYMYICLGLPWLNMFCSIRTILKRKAYDKNQVGTKICKLENMFSGICDGM